MDGPPALGTSESSWKRRGTHTQAHRHRHTDTETHTHTQTYRHTDTQTHRHTDTQTHRHTDTQTHRHTDTQTHRHTDTQTHRHTDTQTHRHTGTQARRHADTQTHRHTDTQTHTHTHTYTRAHTETDPRTHLCIQTLAQIRSSIKQSLMYQGREVLGLGFGYLVIWTQGSIFIFISVEDSASQLKTSHMFLLQCGHAHLPLLQLDMFDMYCRAHHCLKTLFWEKEKRPTFIMATSCTPKCPCRPFFCRYRNLRPDSVPVKPRMIFQRIKSPNLKKTIGVPLKKFRESSPQISDRKRCPLRYPKIFQIIKSPNLKSQGLSP